MQCYESGLWSGGASVPSGQVLVVMDLVTLLRTHSEIALSPIWNVSTMLNAWQFCLAKIRQDSLGFTAVIGHTARLRLKASGKRLFVRWVS